MRLKDYKKLSPFTINELLTAVNELLEDGDVTIRTIRFYVGQGILDRPMGAPKFARYSYEHLVSLLVARMLQDNGYKLHQIVKELEEVKKGRTEKWEPRVDEWLANRVVRERRRGYQVSQGSTVRRISLTDKAILEMASDVDVARELRSASGALNKLIKAFD